MTKEPGCGLRAAASSVCARLEGGLPPCGNHPSASSNGAISLPRRMAAFVGKGAMLNRVGPNTRARTHTPAPSVLQHPAHRGVTLRSMGVAWTSCLRRHAGRNQNPKKG